MPRTPLREHARTQLNGLREQSDLHTRAAVSRTVLDPNAARPRIVLDLLQFHHDDPYAVGGAATVANITLRCAAHNRYEAELFFAVNYPGIVREKYAVWPGGVGVVPKREGPSG